MWGTKKKYCESSRGVQVIEAGKVDAMGTIKGGAQLRLYYPTYTILV